MKEQDVKFYQFIRRNDMTYNGPLFIVGMPRSGTKLLRGLLNQHPLIGIPDAETAFLPFWSKHWNEYGDLSVRSNFSRFYSQNIRLPYFIYMKEGEGLIKEEDWYQSCENFSVSGVFEALIRHDTHTTVGSEKIWGDKTPSYITRVSFLKDLFPSAKFIHIVRDARDYSLSMRAAWQKNMLRAADRWFTDISTLRLNLATHPDSILELRYEDLLENPDKEIHKVCKFLGLTFSEKMLELSMPCENLGKAQGEKKILKNNKEKFRTEMTPKQIESIERIAKPLLEFYGYPVEYPGNAQRINKIALLFYKILDGFNLFKYESSKRGLIGGLVFQWNLHRSARN